MLDGREDGEVLFGKADEILGSVVVSCQKLGITVD